MEFSKRVSIAEWFTLFNTSVVSKYFSPGFSGDNIPTITLATDLPVTSVVSSVNTHILLSTQHFECCLEHRHKKVTSSTCTKLSHKEVSLPVYFSKNALKAGLCNLLKGIFAQIIISH